MISSYKSNMELKEWNRGTMMTKQIPRLLLARACHEVFKGL